MIEVKDQGCQTNAPQSALFVTALGEILRGEECLDCSSVDLMKLRKQHGLTFEETDFSLSDDSPAAQRWHQLVEAEFERKRHKDLSEAELEFVNKTYRLQDVVTDDRFRLYGELRRGGDECVVLVTEFRGFCGDDHFWLAFNDIAQSLQAHVWIMREEPHLDHSYLNFGTPEQQDVYGPDHGRLERQVELSWRVETISVEALQELKVRIAAATEPFWKKYGVSVC